MYDAESRVSRLQKGDSLESGDSVLLSGSNVLADEDEDECDGIDYVTRQCSDGRKRRILT